MGLVIIGVLMYLSISIWSPRAVAVMVGGGVIDWDGVLGRNNRIGKFHRLVVSIVSGLS